MIASNFTTFLQLLTTQLKNQNPLDPLDTNQFTQQLVQFAQVEQQMKSNDQLTTLVSLEKTAQSTTALAYVGATVVVDGSTAPLANGSATWSLNVTKPSTATVTIKDSTGQTAYTGTFAVNPGNQKFTWDGRGNDGKLWPDGNYTLTATGVDANKPVGRHFDRSAGHGGLGRSHAGSAAAVDQRAELHDGQDQADRAPGHLTPIGPSPRPQPLSYRPFP